MDNKSIDKEQISTPYNNQNIQEISKIKLPDNNIYNIKDLEARKGLKLLLGDDYFDDEN